MKNIYLDIDGVLNAVTHKDSAINNDWGSDWVNKKVNGYWILYNETMLNSLNELARRNDVEIIWLTTWVDLACSMMSPAIGINGENWRVLDRDDVIKEDFFKWWKLDAIREDIKKTNPRKVVWIDDDIKHNRSASEWITQHYDLDFKILAVSPFTVSGLTKADFDDIVEFLDAD